MSVPCLLLSTTRLRRPDADERRLHLAVTVVRRPVEPDMALTDVGESEAIHVREVPHSAIRGLFDRHAPETAARIVHIALVPTLAMHCRNARRSQGFSSSLRFTHASLDYGCRKSAPQTSSPPRWPVTAM